MRAKKHSSKEKRAGVARMLFLPGADYYVTPIIIAANTIVFLVMAFQYRGVISFSAENLITWGANYGPLVSEGQWFRISSSIFLHSGIKHLLMNLYALVFVGFTLERVLGSVKLAIAYLVTGIAASVTSLIAHPMLVSVGASGAIFGLYGVLLVIVVVKNFGRAAALVPFIHLLIFLALNLLIGAKTVGIDNAAHIGGSVMGLFVGGMLAWLQVARSPKKLTSAS